MVTYSLDALKRPDVAVLATASTVSAADAFAALVSARLVAIPAAPAVTYIGLLREHCNELVGAALEGRPASEEAIEVAALALAIASGGGR